jgi:hypothetical protein
LGNGIDRTDWSGVIVGWPGSVPPDSLKAEGLIGSYERVACMQRCGSESVSGRIRIQTCTLAEEWPIFTERVAVTSYYCVQ